MRIRSFLRSFGAAAGAFVVLNVVGELLRGPFDTLKEWLTIPLPRGPRLAAELVLAAVLLANAFVASPRPWARRAGAGVLAAFTLLACLDVVAFYRALANGSIETPAPIPASLLVAGLLAFLAADLLAGERSPPAARTRRWVELGAAATALAIALPAVRIATFGLTRYARKADCAVVFGARVWNDGTPSLALSDRVDEAIRLYHGGFVRKILMSGAREPNGFSEPEVMRDRALARGVPASDILLDPGGVDTASTVRNTASILRSEGLGSALVVSHYYHEPRAKLLFDRSGVRAFTVPARMSRRLLREPWFLVREVLAFHVAFLRH